MDSWESKCKEFEQRCEIIIGGMNSNNSDTATRNQKISLSDLSAFKDEILESLPFTHDALVCQLENIEQNALNLQKVLADRASLKNKATLGELTLKYASQPV